jgi:exonuclease III
MDESKSLIEPKQKSYKEEKIIESQPNKFGYHTKNLTDYCGTYEEEFSTYFDKSDNLPKVFKILTWNIWGLNKRNFNGDKYILLSELMLLRMKLVVEIISKKDPDLIIFQEMSYDSLGMIKAFMKINGLAQKYHGYGHNFVKFTPDTMEKNIKRDLENYIFSKWTPDFITQYRVPGNLGYSTAATLVTFKDICIIGCYLQAGSKYSPGQEKVWRHYSRCRSEQLAALDKIIKKDCSNKTVILCGDFNTDLDGGKDDWPEIEAIRDMKLNDAWRFIYPNKEKYPGFTEDTEKNHMRWNMKFMEKRLRYDGFLFKNGKIDVVPIKAVMIGTKSFVMDDDMFDEFMKVMCNTKNSKIRSKTYHASDHFGVMTTFSK